MGAALAASVLRRGYRVTVVSGPVNIDYPLEANVQQVETTEEMLEVSRSLFPDCDGLIGAAAPCDYRPVQVQSEKISKTGKPLVLEMVETPDIVATLATTKRETQWVVGFALESNDVRFRAVVKMQTKCCDLMVSNRPTAIDSELNEVDILGNSGRLLESFAGTKQEVGDRIVHHIDRELIQKTYRDSD